MLPPFESPTGRLPDGEHEADWAEVVDRFGWNLRRRPLLDPVLLDLSDGRAAQKRRFGGELFFNASKPDPG